MYAVESVKHAVRNPDQNNKIKFLPPLLLPSESRFVFGFADAHRFHGHHWCPLNDTAGQPRYCRGSTTDPVLSAAVPLIIFPSAEIVNKMIQQIAPPASFFNIALSKKIIKNNKKNITKNIPKIQKY